MKADQLEVRSIHNKEEYEQVMDLLDKCFIANRDFFDNRLANDSSYDASTTWIVKKQDRITSTIQVFPVSCRIGDTAIKVGGLGNVATDEAFRGQGQSQKLLYSLTDWMKDEHYDLSLLYTNIMPFYEKFGWNIVPQPQYQIKTDLLKAIFSFHSNHKYTIASFDSSYTKDIAHIYEQFNHNRTNTAIRSESYWQDVQKWQRWQANEKLIAMHDGKVVAYGVISTLVNESCFLDELCYLDGHEDAALPLLQALIERRAGIQELFAYLPPDHILESAVMRKAGLCKLYNCGMWKVINFIPLLNKISEQLEQRLLASSFTQLHIELICNQNTAYLHYDNNKLSIESVKNDDFTYTTITLNQSIFIGSLLLGFPYMSDCHKIPHVSVQEVASSAAITTLDISDQARDLLMLLFPNQSSTFYNVDRF